MAEAARLHVTLSADTADFTQAIDRAADGLKKSFIPSLVSAELIADGLQAIGSGLVDFAKGAIDHLAEVEQINAQTAAAIKSTGGAAGVTAQQMSDLANSIEAATGVSGEMIQKGENLLLTFTNIKNGVGAGNDIFNQTTRIMADMSVALGQDATSSAMQLGKALNDPVKGVSALQKVGVSFTEGQKETIKTLQESGRTMEAQKIILKELNKEFGGSADAFGKTFKGSVEKSSAALENLGDAIFENFMPALKMMADTGAEAMNALSTAIADKGLFDGLWSLFGPEMKAAVIGIGAAVTLAVIPALGSLVSAAVAAAVPFVPLIAAAAAIGAAAYLIIKNWDGLKAGFNSLLNGLRGALVTFGNVARSVWDFFVKVALAAFNTLIAPYKAVFNLLPEAAKAPLKQLAGNVANTVTSLPQMVVPHIQVMASGVGSSVSGMVSDVSGFMSQLTTKVKSGFGGLPAHAAAGAAGVADAAAGMSKAAKKAADDAKKHAEDISKSFGDIGGKLKGIDMTAALGGWSVLDTVPKKIAALTDGLKGLTEKGVAPTDKRFQGLVKTLKGLQEQMEALDNGQAAIKAFSGNASALTGLNRELKDIRERATLFGDTINVNSESASALEKTINVLRQSMGATNPIVLKLTEQWKGYRKAAEDVKEETTDVDKIMAKLSDGLIEADVKAKRLGASFDLNAEQAKLYNGALSELAGIGGAQAQTAFEGVGQALAEIPPAQMSATAAMGAFKQSTTDILSAVTGLRDGLKTVAETLGIEVGEGFLDATVKAGNFALALVQIGTSAQSLHAFVLPAFEAIGTAFGVVGTAATAVGAVIAGVVAGTVAAVVGFVVFSKAIVDSLGGAQKAWEVFVTLMSITGQALVEGLKMMAVGIADGILGTIKGMVNAVISGLNFFIRALNSIGFTVPDWIPGLGGKHWSPNVAQIPFLAEGGVISSPTLAMVGEGKHKEAVVPLSPAVFSQMGQGIAAHTPQIGYGGGPSRGGDTYISIEMRVDDAEAGERLVRQLRELGVSVG
jgi:hypothetical protein